jgi:hypothetical protein
MRRLAQPKSATLFRGTDQYELRAEVFTRERFFRDYALCNPIASEFRALFDELAPSPNLGVRRR